MTAVLPEPKRLADRAYAELKRRIHDNELQPGTFVLETELAAMLGVSRTPVREAMIRLAEDGVVEIRPRHGLRVLPISPDDMAEIYAIITALEAEAAEAVARLGIAEPRLAALRRAVEAMDQALAGDDRLAWARADEAFHRELLEACPNRRLRAVTYQFWDQAHRARMATLWLRPKPTTSNADHMALVDAITRGDADAAREIHRGHRARSGALLVSILRQNRLHLV